MHDAQVGAEGDLQSAAQAVAPHRGDDRHRELGPPVRRLLREVRDASVGAPDGPEVSGGVALLGRHVGATVDRAPPSPAMAMNPEKSRPALNARPSPDSTTARTDASRASRAAVSTSATNMSPSRALSLSGRFSRTSATPSSICTVTRSDIGTSWSSSSTLPSPHPTRHAGRA